eukprot:gnl/TRDRNA2_/TRDRNA2_126365_c1_seq1.p1 gnl/TRDRNA2_/TRDRNA2_126365_c1~~gnl/TRDRNA2_/TRDRNA2_126365_c1_seq1.p1  ORF type:complete len:341 (-),score=44.52 gnl/TRDRNA2_/TRDRNA2_126365_c1_seq1:498-1454(-)
MSQESGEDLEHAFHLKLVGEDSRGSDGYIIKATNAEDAAAWMRCLEPYSRMKLEDVDAMAQKEIDGAHTYVAAKSLEIPATCTIRQYDRFMVKNQNEVGFEIVDTDSSGCKACSRTRQDTGTEVKCKIHKNALTALTATYIGNAQALRLKRLLSHVREKENQPRAEEIKGTLDRNDWIWVDTEQVAAEADVVQLLATSRSDVKCSGGRCWIDRFYTQSRRNKRKQAFVVESESDKAVVFEAMDTLGPFQLSSHSGCKLSRGKQVDGFLTDKEDGPGQANRGKEGMLSIVSGCGACSAESPCLHKLISQKGNNFFSEQG